MGDCNVNSSETTKLRWYPIRTVIGALGPAGVAITYIAIYIFGIREAASVGDIDSGPPGANYAFYVWFALSVFGLSLGEHGLAGVEAGLAMTHEAPHAGHILLHADKTWSGPGGWVRAIGSFWSWRNFPSRNWTILFVTTLIPYMAIPLSGLTLELRRGYSPGFKPAVVYGANSSTFNESEWSNTIRQAQTAWRTARTERPPLQGAVYTRDVQGIPLSVLSSEGVPDIFLAPQVSGYVSGRTWGLSVRYNCSVVSRLDHFILYKNKSSVVPSDVSSQAYLVSGSPEDKPDSPIFVSFNWTRFKNVEARLEIATTLDRDSLFNFRQYRRQKIDINNGTTQYWRQYPGLDQTVTIEAVLWQTILAHDFSGPGSRESISEDVGTVVADLVDTSGTANFSSAAGIPAVGVTCNCSSAVGHATVDGLRQTFSDFERADIVHTETLPPFFANSSTVRWSSPAIFPVGVLHMLLHTDGIANPAPSPEDWVKHFFASVRADRYIPIFNASFWDGSNGAAADSPYYFILLRRLTSDDLRASMLQAFGSYATQLMYRGSQQITASTSSSWSWQHENLTLAEPGLILAQGPVHPFVVAVLLCLWAALCFTLSLRYAFGRRWADTLDAYSVFRFGADACAAGSFQSSGCPPVMAHCALLTGLPGMVGDSQPEKQVGHVALARARLDRRKRYGVEMQLLRDLPSGLSR